MRADKEAGTFVRKTGYMKTTITGLLLAAVFHFNTYSQDTLVLLSGKTITGEITFAKEKEISIISKGFLSDKEYSFYKDELFSVSRGFTKTVLYAQDITGENKFSVEQMEAYINGLNDGRKYYHTPVTTIAGFVTGATGGFFGFWGMTIPAAYVFAAGIKTPELETPFLIPVNVKVIAEAPEAKQYGLSFTTIDNYKSTDEESIIPYYKYGYETAAKDKKIKNAIFGSVAGFVALAVTSYILVAR